MLKGNSNGGAGLSASVCSLPHSLLTLAALVFVLVLLGEASAWGPGFPKLQVFKGDTGPCASGQSSGVLPQS